MSLLVRFFLSVYSVLLKLYPPLFRREFQEEMTAVCADKLADATERGWLPLLNVCSRELWELPVNLVQQNLSTGKEKLAMKTRTNNDLLEVKGGRYGRQMADDHSWRVAMAGTLLFLSIGLFLILNEIPDGWPMLFWLPGIHGVAIVAMLVLPTIGFGVGLANGFPRWSYPYIVYVLLVSLYMMGQPTPSLRLFGFTFGSDGLLGWWAWIPCLVMFAILLLYSRSLRPAGKFFTNIWNDWTLLTWAMFGFLPLLAGLSFDEMDRLYSLPFMVLITLVASGTALVYLRSVQPRQKLLVLLAGTTVMISVATMVPALYWQRNGMASGTGPFQAAATLWALMFAPALIGLLHYSIGLRSSA